MELQRKGERRRQIWQTPQKEKVSIQKVKMEKERIRARKEEVSLDRKENQTILPRARIRLVVVLVSLAKTQRCWDEQFLSLVSTVANQATKQITVTKTGSKLGTR